jgi:hypothetical protein
MGTSVKSIEGLLGRADSVISIDWENTCPSNFKSENSKIAYYRGFDFEQFGDSLSFLSVDFTEAKEAFLQSGDLKLSHLTTLEEFKKRFQEAIKNISKLKV